jgi:hypothetical protein
VTKSGPTWYFSGAVEGPSGNSKENRKYEGMNKLI